MQKAFTSLCPYSLNKACRACVQILNYTADITAVMRRRTGVSCAQHRQMAMMGISDKSHVFHAGGDIMTLPFYWTMHNDGVAYADGRYGRVYSEDAFMMMHGAYAGNGTA